MSLESVLKLWIESVTGYDSANVKQAFGGGPIPAGDYVTFFAYSDDADGGPFRVSRSADDDTVVTTHDQPSTVTVQIDVYSHSGRAMLNRLLQSTSAWEHRKILYEGGLALRRRSSINNLTETDGDVITPRFQADFEFGYGSQFVETEQAVETASITGSLSPAEGDAIPVSVDIDLTE